MLGGTDLGYEIVVTTDEGPNVITYNVLLHLKVGLGTSMRSRLTAEVAALGIRFEPPRHNPRIIGKAETDLFLLLR